MAFDGEMEPIANIMDHVNDSEIAGDFTIHSDAHEFGIPEQALGKTAQSE
jgi:hypothetical protein